MHCKSEQYALIIADVPWCNGSTRVFGSLSPRSNRSGTTSPSPNPASLPILRRVLLFKQCLYDTAFLVVRSAWALSNGCKSLTSPNSGNCIANSKGVHREVKSERSRWQTSDLTYRNFIQGIWPWVRLLNKPKPYSYSERSVEFPWACEKMK